MRLHLIMAASCLWTAFSAAAQALPPSDQRAGTVVTLRSTREFPKVYSRSDWQNRAEEIRQQILLSCGLSPMPEKTPLNARMFDRTIHDGYSVEKVLLETFPGFFLAGNLYRPLEGQGPFPAVLNPHGHWPKGRLEDSAEGSVPARCIHFARQGMIAFSYDLVGYNDTVFAGQDPEMDFYQRHRQFAADPSNLLWGISLMGVQTWNSIRALDFLESLPDVDRSRLACTGGSGGGTQTFILGAIDDRLRALAPVAMVSHSMQGGCPCENVCGLRIDYSNMEIAAAAAPKAQMLVGATGDWTRTTPELEGPAIGQVYRLLRASERFRHATFDFGHNYNQASREAVYEWFGRWLLNSSDSVHAKEAPYNLPAVEDLRLSPADLPASALTHEEFVASLKQAHQEQLRTIQPRNWSMLKNYKKQVTPLWERTLRAEVPRWGLVSELVEERRHSRYTMRRLVIGRDGKGDRLPVIHLVPNQSSIRFTVILAHPEGKSVWLDSAGNPMGLAKRLLENRQGVLLLDTFLTGDLADEEARARRDHLANFFTTYNRTDAQERVQDLITACTYAQRHGKAPRVVLAGFGRAGLWALLAAPAADAIAADCSLLKVSNENALLDRDIFVPGLLRIGGFQGVATLAAPRPMFLHNTGLGFETDWLESVYNEVRSAKSLRVDRVPMGEEDVLDWILRL